MNIFPKRNFTLSLKQEGTGKTAQVAIEQKEFRPIPVFSCSKTDFHIDASAQELTIPIESYWTNAKGSATDIFINFADLKDEQHQLVDSQIKELHPGKDGFLVVQLKENTSYEQAKISIELTQIGIGILSNESIIINITQDGKPDDGKFAVNPSTLSIDAAGSRQTVIVTSTSKGKNAPWSVSTPDKKIPDWISKPKVGSNPGELIIDVHSNDNMFYLIDDNGK